MKKCFLSVVIFTLTCGAISFAFASMAGLDKYPDDLAHHLNKQLNTNQHQVHINKTHSVRGVDSLQIEVDDADVELVSQPGLADLNITLIGPSNEMDPLQVTQSKNELKIKVKKQDRLNWKISLGDEDIENQSLRLKIILPAEFQKNVTIHVGSGDVKGSDLTLNSVQIRSGSGDVIIKQVKFISLMGKTGSGDLDLSGQIETVDIQTGSGDLSIDSLVAKSLRAVTGSGEIDIRQLLADQARAKSGSGDIEVKLQDLKPWTAELETGSGELTNEFSTTTNKEATKLTAGSGPRKLQLESGSGDISIKR